MSWQGMRQRRGRTADVDLGRRRREVLLWRGTQAQLTQNGEFDLKYESPRSCLSLPGCAGSRHSLAGSKGSGSAGGAVDIGGILMGVPCMQHTRRARWGALLSHGVRRHGSCCNAIVKQHGARRGLKAALTWGAGCAGHGSRRPPSFATSRACTGRGVNRRGVKMAWKVDA